MQLNAIPKHEHYAVITYNRASYYDSYDDLQYVDENHYLPFDNEESLSKWIASQVTIPNSIEFRVIKVQPMIYDVKTTVSFAK